MKFRLVNIKVRICMGILCVERRLMLKCIFKKGDLKLLTELHWLRVSLDGL
jgi:hypothetical protein